MCMNEATTKPTDAGVRVAAVQCARQYPDEYQAQQQQPRPNPVPQHQTIDQFLSEEAPARSSWIDRARTWWAGLSPSDILLIVGGAALLVQFIIVYRRGGK